MTDFASAVADYLQTRRSMGYKLTQDGRLLRQFAAGLDTVGAEHLRTADALSWATDSDAAPAWRAGRLGIVRSFARWLVALDPMTEIPPGMPSPCRSSSACDNINTIPAASESPLKRPG